MRRQRDRDRRTSAGKAEYLFSSATFCDILRHWRDDSREGGRILFWLGHFETFWDISAMNMKRVIGSRRQAESPHQYALAWCRTPSRPAGLLGRACRWVTASRSVA